MEEIGKPFSSREMGSRSSSSILVVSNTDGGCRVVLSQCVAIVILLSLPVFHYSVSITLVLCTGFYFDGGLDESWLLSSRSNSLSYSTGTIESILILLQTDTCFLAPVD